ncbi:ribonuclease H-like domain-containing protein [Tanacetum coccineum]
MDTPLDFSAFVMNRVKVDTPTPELLVGPAFELMKGSCKSRQVIPFDHFINNDLAYLSGGVSSRTYTTSVTKTKSADYGHIKWIEDLVPNRMWSQVPVSYDKHALWRISHWGRKRQQFYGFAANREYARDVYSKRRIIVVTKLQIVEWHNYKHLDWIIIHIDDDKLYKFKEGDFNRLRIQDIEDMLLLLVQGKLTNLTVEERLAFNVSLRMFTRSIVIQRRVEDLQLGNKDKKNKLMRIDELHKFSDGTLNDVRTALNDRLKGIRMKYLPQTIWRQSDRDKAGAMIQAIDKQLKTRRIMRSLEKFVEHAEFDESNAYVLERFYTSAGNPVKEILLKLNLPDHRSILTDSKVTPTKHGRMTKPYSSPRFIANCFNARYLKMEVKHKFHADGTLSRYKARLVANGSSQQLGVDFDETFSLVVKPATICTVLSLAVSRKWSIYQLDVKNAFLNSDLSETIYMHQPPGFVDSRYATRIRFYHSRCDSSLFIYIHGSQIAYLLIYVDDIILTTSSPALLQQIIDSLHSEFDMTDLGALNYFLGISVVCHPIGLFLSQWKYALQLLEHTHMVNCNPSRTLVDTESKLGPEGVPVQDPTLYRSLTGGATVSHVYTSRFVLCSTTNLSLYARSARATFCRSQTYLAIHSWDFGFWSTLLCIRHYLSGDNLLSWSAKRQHTLSRSSAEAEYRGVANVVAETAWLRNLLRELHSPLSTATIVYYDNVSAIYMSANPVQHQRTKYIEIDIHSVRDMVTAG